MSLLSYCNFFDQIVSTYTTCLTLNFISLIPGLGTIATRAFNTCDNSVVIAIIDCEWLTPIWLSVSTMLGTWLFHG